jgi:hypothetical protein
VATISIPQGVRGWNHRRGCLGSKEHTTSRMEDSSLMRNMRQKEVIVRTSSMRKELFQFSYENARFEALHFQPEAKQFEIRLPTVLAKLPQQNSFEVIK